MRQILALPAPVKNALTLEGLPVNDVLCYVAAAHRCVLTRRENERNRATFTPTPTVPVFKPAAPQLSKEEIKVLKDYAGLDVGTVLGEYNRALDEIAEPMRTAGIDMDQHAVTIGRLPLLTDDGKKLTITIAKDAPNREVLLATRQGQALAQHARRIQTSLAAFAALWRECLAAGIAIRALTLPSAKVKPGKRMESHLTAVALGDPGTIAQALKAKGLDDAAIGSFLAVLAKVGMAAPAAPAALPAPV